MEFEEFSRILCCFCPMRKLTQTVSLFPLFILCWSSLWSQQVQPHELNPRYLDSINARQPKRIFSLESRRRFGYSENTKKKSRKPSGVVSLETSRSGGRCYDTSGRFFLKNDSITFYAFHAMLSSDNKILVSGEYTINKPPWNLSGGFFLKCDTLGNVEWTKLYDSANSVRYDFISYYDIAEMHDGTYILAGYTWDDQNDNDDMIITRTDNSGNVLWHRIYKSRLWQNFSGSGDYFYVQQMAEDPASGDIYLTGPHWAYGKNVTRLKSSNGDIVWSKAYDIAYDYSFDRPFGMLIEGDEIISFTRFSGYSGGNNLSILRINKNTGDTIQAKALSMVIGNSTDWKNGILSPSKVVKLNNGNYAISGNTYGYINIPNDPSAPLTHAAVVELDPNFNFVRGYVLRNFTESNNYNTKITVFPDGSGFFTMLKYSSGYNGDVLYVQFNNGQITKQRLKYYFNSGMPYINDAIRLPTGGDMDVKLLGDSINSTSRIEFITLHTSDTSSDCVGYDVSETYIAPVRYAPLDWGIGKVHDNDFNYSKQKSIRVRETSLGYIPGCKQASFCDSFGLRISKDTICLSMVATLTIRKNKECGAIPFFRYDTSIIQSFTRVTDTTFSLRFKSAWSGWISGSVLGCMLLEDSVKITVLQSPDTLDLGPDKSICPGNKILLNAKAGYSEYLWNDGSNDSTLTVAAPGRYFVKAKDGCGVVRYDTVDITAAPAIPFNVGPDRIKCNTDTIHLQAPGGFLNYNWSNNYNISSLTSQAIIVNPLTDTVYFVKAEKTPGCFAFDTVRIKVNRSMPVFLGNDTTLCQGQNILLNAGAGFSNYLWNGIGGTQQISVNTAGTYSVIASTAEGCKSYDTLKILSVFANPVVSLNKNKELCSGDIRELDATAFNRYLWHDGSTSRTFVASGTGTFSVQVWDSHGCTGRDTTRITTILPLPSDFLPADTSICSYGKLSLGPVRSYEKYLWSTNAASSTIAIARPGLYKLQVTDADGCVGKDSITIYEKQCLKGLYVPTAFTPNKDGHNDIMRAMLFGDIKAFEFTIFNRWGEIIFRTNDPSRGWDGTQTGRRVESNSFIWTCRYQLADEPVQFEKGTFVIVR